MDSGREAFPDDIVALKAALVIEAARAVHAEAELAVARAKASDDAGKKPGAQIKTTLEALVRVREFSIVYTANSLRFTGVKNRAGLTCRYPCCVVVPTTTIGVISNAYDLLRATPSEGPGT
jgi:hypothetical protein